MKFQPLADRIRPTTLADVVGQPHILGESGLLRRIIESGSIPNMIFYGPSGVGKTTVASIIAGQTERKLYRLNATTASISDIRQIFDELGTMLAPNGALIYLDEIQYFNKKQQQSLLEFIEDGRITLIASTTENPYFYVYSAILSRCTVFEFRPVGAEEVEPAVRRAFSLADPSLSVSDEVCAHIASSCGGDVRKAMNAVELLAQAARGGTVTLADAEQAAQRSAMRYDRDGDQHYDILSGLQKSIRGSDPDAAVHYLARLLEAGDLISACRRLLVIAAEDVGLAYPQAISIVKACVDTATQLGLPEARIPLADAAILLATAPKSNSGIRAIDAAMQDVRDGKAGEVPDYLKDSHYSGAGRLGHGLAYRFPHDYPNHWVEQQYLPDTLRGAHYYDYGENKTEQRAKAYWDAVKGRI
ncbi:MAG: replication-associated recombination protein A [Butyricicoccus porcorum]|uniref:replication-associated recombination protein A n=1 Tax=Butyricicoccus porcorum TaxID=1945634 RepID=UPI0023542903|nr:replication-associated recombination protein A [Butyricicoccus porcorum]MDD6986103.1 replication-associated recombination protein A [Butyricicoccus porcorum]